MQVTGGTNVALVWESASCEDSNIADFYPGDENVDWVRTNYECANEAIQFAHDHFKLVMLTAASQGESEWFPSFFKFVADNNDVVRTVAYFNSGESRLSDTDIIKNWKTETKKSFWLRATPDLFSDLGFGK